MNSIKLNKVIFFKFKDSFYNKTINFLFVKCLERNSQSYNTTFLLKLFCELKVSLLFSCYKGYYYYYSFYLQSDVVPLQVHTDYACYYKENPPVPIQRQKPRKCIGKMPCLKLTLGKGKPISYYLLEQLSIQGFLPTCTLLMYL